MLVDSLFKYFQNFEKNIQEGDNLEKQFLDLTHYKSENFNLNNFSKIVMSKITETNFLIKNLNEIVNVSRAEIVNQITSDINNYIVLISKLQNIDFLIDNIDKPLFNIKNKVISEINYISKYEEYLKKIYNFTVSNCEENKNIILLIRYYSLFEVCFKQSEKIKKDYFNDINNICLNSDELNIFEYYGYIKKFLNENLKNEFRFQQLIKMEEQLNID